MHIIPLKRQRNLPENPQKAPENLWNIPLKRPETPLRPFFLGSGTFLETHLAPFQMSRSKTYPRELDSLIKALTKFMHKISSCYALFNSCASSQWH